MGFPNVTIEDMYGAHFAEFYDSFFSDNTDLPFFKNVVSLFGNNVMELGCGNGRITIPLLKEGCNVTAVDLSDYMLKILEKKAVGYNPCIIKGDMCTVQVENEQDVVILPVSTLLIIKDKEKLFRNVHKNLKKGGAFAFWYNDYSSYNNSMVTKPIYVFNKRKKLYGTLTEKYDKTNNIVDANVLLEEAIGETSQKYLAATRKYLITLEEMSELITSTCFKEFSSSVVKTEHSDYVYKVIVKC